MSDDERAFGFEQWHRARPETADALRQREYVLEYCDSEWFLGELVLKQARNASAGRDDLDRYKSPRSLHLLLAISALLVPPLVLNRYLTSPLLLPYRHHRFLTDLHLDDSSSRLFYPQGIRIHPPTNNRFTQPPGCVHDDFILCPRHRVDRKEDTGGIGWHHLLHNDC